MPGETLSDRYLIERKLGSGGAAEVLLAADTILHRQVAIKRLHGWLSADREARVRFQQEAQAFARLTHPHIVTLFDVGEDNNRPYLVMEYLEGETLRKIIAAEGPFHPDDIAVVIEHIGEALDYAHKRGVVHRDIKPENVLVDRTGSSRWWTSGSPRSSRTRPSPRRGSRRGQPNTSRRSRPRATRSRPPRTSTRSGSSPTRCSRGARRSAATRLSRSRPSMSTSVRLLRRT
jgi:serine/threonine protein kinase